MSGTIQTQFQITDELIATHKQRFSNWFIDLIVQVIFLFLILVFITAIALSNGNKEFMVSFVKNDIAQYTVVTCTSLLYYNFFEIFFAKTFGKFITQTVVVDINGDKPHHETILIRSLCRLIPFEILSFITMPARGWHDSLSKTYVVDKRLLDQSKRKFHNSEETKSVE
ncbi:RDD family protein [Flavobacterium sp.]|uniref:RDD family protein n=1 Tax=Flavobacterium sp. TaxID=239 RepID=UPI0025E02637|nr:RDD family protein [Flavobacterium sp.]